MNLKLVKLIKDISLEKKTSKVNLQTTTLAFLLLLFIPFTSIANPVDDGIAYLSSSQLPDGAWFSTQARDVHVTTEVIKTLQILATGASERGLALSFLDTALIEDTDDRARRAEVFASEGFDTSLMVDRLLLDRDVLEGWGLTNEFNSNPLDTARALMAFSSTGFSDNSILIEHVAFLAETQNEDGGWGCVRDGPSDVSCTSVVLFSMSLYRQQFFVDSFIDAGVSYLRNYINSDFSIGGFTVDPVYSTSLAILALVASGNNLTADRFDFETFLLNEQDSDGSWRNDPLFTALALRALNSLSVIPVCGDGIINRPEEACDGSDLSGNSCSSLGLGTGVLNCTSQCTFDTRGCEPLPFCGDGIINQADEQCEGANLAGNSCDSLGFGGGTLSCNNNCTFDTSACTASPECGDGVINQESEACDGSDVGGNTCESLNLGTGSVSCNPDCTLNTNECVESATCGDNDINASGEQCDGTDLSGLSCEDLGFGPGTLGCSSDCTFDTGGCSPPPTCGDGMINQVTEICDGSDLSGLTCEALGFVEGTLYCNADCTLDGSGCVAPPVCGDGKVNRESEECDLADFDEQSCSSLGLATGTLRCANDCSFDTSGCSGGGSTVPNQITFGPDSRLCTEGEQTVPVSINFPETSVIDKVDVFFLFDDTGSFSNVVSPTISIFESLVEDLTISLPDVNFGFGAAKFEVFGGVNRFYGQSRDRPFILNQPIITTDIADFNNLITAALSRRSPGTGVAPGPGESSLEALFQTATGAGFDADGNGSSLDNGPAGEISGQINPGNSGDVPSFNSNVAITSGTLGGAGFREGSLRLVLLATDICSISAYDSDQGIPDSITGLNGRSLPSNAFHCGSIGSGFGFVSDSKTRSGNTVPHAVLPQGSATVPDTIDALNSLGISVIGLGPGAAPQQNPVGPSNNESVLLSAVALLTGAVDETGNPLVFNISGGADPIRNAIVDAITTAATRPVDVSVRYVDLSGNISASILPDIVPGVAPGGQAEFQLDVEGGEVPEGEFTVEFFDNGTNAVLGEIPVMAECLPVVEPPVDKDGDEFSNEVDCDDNDSAINPEAGEILHNGKDDDCNPETPDVITVENLACTVATDKISYSAQEEIHVNVVTNNLNEATTISGIQLEINVEHSSGISLGSVSETLTPLSAGEQRQNSFFFQTGSTQPGELFITVDLFADSQTFTSCTMSSEILSSTESGVSLGGNIVPEPSSAFLGDQMELIYSVENIGNIGLNSANLEIVIADPDTGDVFITLFDTPSIGVGDTYNSYQVIPEELPVGEYISILRGGPEKNLSTLDSSLLSILQPPNISPVCDDAVATSDELWPPNHKFREIGVFGVTDPDGDTINIQITRVLQDEGVLENGSGNTCPDSRGAGSETVEIRSERVGSGDGRVYHINFKAEDGKGGVCEGVVTVCVPHDRGRGRECVDQGPLFDSNVCP